MEIFTGMKIKVILLFYIGILYRKTTSLYTMIAQIQLHEDDLFSSKIITKPMNIVMV